jgi:hypothetical protein
VAKLLLVFNPPIEDIPNAVLTVLFPIFIVATMYSTICAIIYAININVFNIPAILYICNNDMLKIISPSLAP